MSRLILHIGTHKTGTTAFQVVMHANRARLAEAGLIYPDFGLGADHHGLTQPWVQTLPDRYHVPGGAEAALSGLVRDHARSDRTVILSSEEFSRGSPALRVDMARLRALLDGFDEVRVICALRAQIGFLQSIYLQVLSDGRVLDWEAVLKQALKRHLATGVFLNYNELDDHLLTGFDAGQITYLDYDTLRRTPGGTPAVLLAEIAPGFDFSGLTLPHDGEVNVSGPEPLTAWVAGQLTAPQRPGGALIATVQQMIDVQSGPGLKSTLYSRTQAQTVVRRFGPLNAAFRARIAARGGRVPALTLAVPDPGILHREDLGAPFFTRLARHFYDQATNPASA